MGNTNQTRTRTTEIQQNTSVAKQQKMSISANPFTMNTSCKPFTASDTTSNGITEFKIDITSFKQLLNSNFTPSTSSGYTSEESRHVHKDAPESEQKYKTELCKNWIETNTCRYGRKCQFAHGNEELDIFK